MHSSNSTSSSSPDPLAGLPVRERIDLVAATLRASPHACLRARCDDARLIAEIAGCSQRTVRRRQQATLGLILAHLRRHGITREDLQT